MRRRGPRPVSHAVEALTGRLAPATLLAEVQRAWPAAAGQFAAHGEPWRERDGVVTVACPEAVWASELSLMSELVVGRLNEALGREAVRGLKVEARAAPER